jgi:hypothetical protein
MLHAFVGLDATERADIVAALIRCRVLAAKIANELRNKRPEYFVDKLSLADIHASLERATDVLSTVKGSQAPGRQCHRRVAEMKMLDKTEQSDRANPNEKPENCYCSALPKGSGLCLPCYTRWLSLTLAIGQLNVRGRDPALTSVDMHAARAARPRCIERLE